MAIDEDVRALSAVPLFRSFSGEQLRLIAFGTEHLTVTKGRELYREGQEADCGFIILSGALNLLEENGMNRRIVKTAIKGSLLGELALIAPAKRPTSAVAAEDTQVMRINRSLIRRVLEEYPELAATLHGEIAGRFQEFLGDITRLEGKFAD
jgi:CRP-like cAMP-binding protein